MPLDPVMSTGPFRLVLADRQILFRRALHTALMGVGWEGIEEVDSTELLWEAVRRPDPGILLLDQHLTGQPVLAFASDLLAQVPELRILVLVASERDTALFQLDALLAGVVGCVSKEHPSEVYCDLIKHIAHGRSVFQHTTIRLALGELSVPAPRVGEANDRLRDLTGRELEVLELLAQGLANPAIATALQITENTVMKHISNLMGKLQARNRREASLIYIRNRDPLAVRSRLQPGRE